MLRRTLVLFSKTKENLLAAFAGESMARNKYEYWAKVARAEGYHYIADVFEETSMNEMQHAKEHFKLLEGIGSTQENLAAAIEGELYETEVMYPTFAAEAKEENEMEAARLFKTTGGVEAAHAVRYQTLLDLIENDSVFYREVPIIWKCGKCGFQLEGNEPPIACPVCKHEREYFLPDDVMF